MARQHPTISGKDRRPPLPPTGRPLTVAFVSLGCPKNLVDSEKMLGLLAEHGIAPAPDPADADVIVINTCGFLQAARRESLDAIARAAGFKRTGRASRVVVAGCLVTRMGAEILREVPAVDALVGVNKRDSIVEAVLGGPGAASPRLRVPASPRLFLPDTARLRLTPRHYAYLRISEGCSRGCSFCTIPAIRGPMRSKPVEMVMAEARELIADGAVELNLIGQDTTGYGGDRYPSPLGRGGGVRVRGQLAARLTAGGASPAAKCSPRPALSHRERDNRIGLAGLLRKLDRLPGVRWLRLLYAYPNDFTDDIIAALAECRHVVPYVDLPLQHINDRILARMNRRVTRRQVEALLARLRARVPGVAIRTTFITGFPGETAAEHRELLAFIENFGFDMLGVFGYSREPGTPAGRMAGQVSERVKRARRAELMEAQQRIVLRRNALLVGTETTALIDRVAGGGVLVGRMPSQAPEVDSVTFVRADRSAAVGSAAVRRPSKNALTGTLQTAPGQIVPIRITGYRGYDLVAETIVP